MAAARQKSLSTRQKQVLTAIVEEHIRTARPVGSRTACERYNLSVSTATIRNDMAALERAGYVTQPHTSAGRVPTQKAYRFYVDQMLNEKPTVSREWAWMSGEFRRTSHDVETLLQAATRVLSEMTRHPALASAPYQPGPTIRTIKLRPVSATSMRVEYTTSDGTSHQVLVDYPQGLTGTQIDHLDKLFTSHLRGKEVDSIWQLDPLTPQQAGEVADAFNSLVEQLKEHADVSGQPVYVEGTIHILQEPEFTERDKLCTVMETLTEQASLRPLLHAAAKTDGIFVTIGTENQISALDDCSLVAKRYVTGSGRAGTVGVLGPMRMPYRRVIWAVSNVARRVEQLLNNDSHLVDQ